MEQTKLYEKLKRMKKSSKHMLLTYRVRFSMYKCTLDQGLLYLDGRNSQKCLHQTQANF